MTIHCWSKIAFTLLPHWMKRKQSRAREYHFHSEYAWISEASLGPHRSQNSQENADPEAEEVKNQQMLLGMAASIHHLTMVLYFVLHLQLLQANLSRIFSVYLSVFFHVSAPAFPPV